MFIYLLLISILNCSNKSKKTDRSTISSASSINDKDINKKPNNTTKPNDKEEVSDNENYQFSITPPLALGKDYKKINFEIIDGDDNFIEYISGKVDKNYPSSRVNPQNFAVTAIKGDRFLAIKEFNKKKNNPWNYPGGKAEYKKGTYLENAIQELYEETKGNFNFGDEFNIVGFHYNERGKMLVLIIETKIDDLTNLEFEYDKSLPSSYRETMGMRWFKTDDKGHYFIHDQEGGRVDLRMRFDNPDITEEIYNTMNRDKKPLATIKVTTSQ